MIPSEELKKLKALVGQFHEEIKSNSLTDLIVWIDCKLEYIRKRDIEIREFKRKHGLECMDFELWLWDKPRWKGRKPNKIWHKGDWKKILI